MIITRTVKISPEERARREKNKRLAKLILIKIPLVLWVMFAAFSGIFASNWFAGFAAVLVVTGIAVVPWAVLWNLLIDYWD